MAKQAYQAHVKCRDITGDYFVAVIVHGRNPKDAAGKVRLGGARLRVEAVELLGRHPWTITRFR